MAPSSRPHPYRATSTVNTPEGPRTSAWLAGHGGLPGDWDPPPPRPVLILVDYSPLQELTHRSQPDHALFSALASSNFRNVSAGELEALFTWTRQFEPIEAGIFPLRDLRAALTTRLRTQWDIHMVPSDLEFRYADLQGDVFQVPIDWTIMQLLDEYRPEWRIRQYNYIESTWLVPGTSQPFILRLRCHKVRQGIILPWFHAKPGPRSKKTVQPYHGPHLISPPHVLSLYKTEFIHFILDSGLHQHVYMALYCFSINTVWRLFVPSAFGFYQLYSRDRFTHGAQAWRNRGGLGMAFDFEPWDFFYRSWYKARPPDCWVECLWRFPSYDLDHLGIFGAKYCTQWPRHYITNGHIFSSNAAWCTFPDTREFHLQCFPSRSLLITGGPSDPLQDLYSFQQHGSYLLKRSQPQESPNVVTLNIISMVFLAIGSGLYELRTIGAITLRSP